VTKQSWRQPPRKGAVATEPPPGTLALSANQVAWLLGVSVNTVWNLLADDRLPSFTVGRRRLVAKSDIEAFIAKASRTKRPVDHGGPS
jgi:excisionase family DNA binding protein